MTKIAVFAGGHLTSFPRDFAVFVGVDRGSLAILRNDLPLDLAVGDFDSVTAAERQLIQEKAKMVITAVPEKDDTDTELALKVIFAKYPQAQVSLFGAFGGRIDHTLANLFLPSDPDLAPFMHRIRLQDEQNVVQFYPAGVCQVFPEKGMPYVSFMAEGYAPLTIEGAKYNLDANHFFTKKVYASNAFIGQPITVTLESGYLIVIHSKDR